MKRVTKDEAIKRLFDAGHRGADFELQTWRSVENTNQGWDGWINHKYPQLRRIIWKKG
jgi:hypothetical protein